jgi:hypothetical protein
MRFRDRVVACFKGMATGDAVGKQTEIVVACGRPAVVPGRSRGISRRVWNVIPRYAGMRYEWRIGEVTDDTEQTIAVAEALLRTGEAKHEEVGKELTLPKVRSSSRPDVGVPAPGTRRGWPSRVMDQALPFGLRQSPRGGVSGCGWDPFRVVRPRFVEASYGSAGPSRKPPYQWPLRA